MKFVIRMSVYIISMYMSAWLLKLLEMPESFHLMIQYKSVTWTNNNTWCAINSDNYVFVNIF